MTQPPTPPQPDAAAALTAAIESPPVIYDGFHPPQVSGEQEAGEPDTPTAAPLPMIAGKNGGRLLTGGKPGPRKGYNKNTKNAAMKEITHKLLEQLSVGIASGGDLHDRVQRGDLRGLETATRILETVHDRVYGKPVLSKDLADGDDGDGSGKVQHIVQIGAVQIVF